jgi:ABC-type oligopeptide transport system ATPase subunit
MIVSLLQDLHRSHKLTSIYVTHNLSFATRCDRILQLDKGDLTRWAGTHQPAAHQSEDNLPALLAAPGTSDNVEGRR